MSLNQIGSTTAAPLVNLSGKRGLVIGIANEHSIAAGCAQAFAAHGATLAATYLNDLAYRQETVNLALEPLISGFSSGQRHSQAGDHVIVGTTNRSIDAMPSA